MKIGYIVVPEEIARLWFEKKRFYANRVSRVEQVTLSKFIDLGYYEKHIRYMRSIYHEKSIALKNAVYSSSLGSVAQISGDDAGMFCRASFNIDIPEKQANKLLAENGVKLSPLSTSVEDTYRAYFPENTYTVGCGEMKISQIRDGIALWARTWEKYLK
jgi:GntR family transcriptional regulator/MocR family aminotransferase